MKIVPLKIDKVEITNFYPQMNTAEVRINFTDEKEDCVKKTIEIKKAEEYTHELFNEIKQKVKDKFKQEETDDVLGGQVVIKFLQDSDEILGKLERFLKSLKDKTVISRMDKESYYDLQKNAMRMKLKF